MKCFITAATTLSSITIFTFFVVKHSTTITEVAAATSAVTVCPKKGSIAEGMKYHDNTVCHRDAYNQFKGTIGRQGRIQAYKNVGGVSTVPNQKTITCPAGGARVRMTMTVEDMAANTVQQTQTPAPAMNIGLDTVWVVENHASTAIVISYVNKDGIEVSARNPKISPAISDPSTILQPNQWMAVYAFEGHEFVVREVIRNGGTILAAGNVLLQHRAGLIPVGTNAAASSLTCDTHQPDIEPKINATSTITSPIFRRTPTTTDRPCNTMDIGFRNVAGCPLHGYYVHGEGERCQEQFKLHLGVESRTHDFFNDWVSSTKFEGTFIGHTFHFRLASNPTVLVDTITLAPVYVTDCPTSSSSGVAVATEARHVPIMEQIGTVEFSMNATDTTTNNGMYETLLLHYPTNSTSIRSNLPLDEPLLSKTILKK